MQSWAGPSLLPFNRPRIRSLQTLRIKLVTPSPWPLLERPVTFRPSIRPGGQSVRSYIELLVPAQGAPRILSRHGGPMAWLFAAGCPRQPFILCQLINATRPDSTLEHCVPASRSPPQTILLCVSGGGSPTGAAFSGIVSQRWVRRTHTLPVPTPSSESSSTNRADPLLESLAIHLVTVW